MLTFVFSSSLKKSILNFQALRAFPTGGERDTSLAEGTAQEELSLLGGLLSCFSFLGKEARASMGKSFSPDVPPPPPFSACSSLLSFSFFLVGWGHTQTMARRQPHGANAHPSPLCGFQGSNSGRQACAANAKPFCWLMA